MEASKREEEIGNESLKDENIEDIDHVITRCYEAQPQTLTAEGYYSIHITIAHSPSQEIEEKNSKLTICKTNAEIWLWQ